MQILIRGRQIMSQQSQLFLMAILEKSSPIHNNERLFQIDLSYVKAYTIRKCRTTDRKL